MTGRDQKSLSNVYLKYTNSKIAHLNKSIDFAEITDTGLKASISKPKYYNDNFRTSSQILRLKNKSLMDQPDPMTGKSLFSSDMSMVNLQNQSRHVMNNGSQVNLEDVQ